MFKVSLDIVLQSIKMMGDVFVNILKPGGHMHDDVVEALRLIWNKSWDDQIILNGCCSKCHLAILLLLSMNLCCFAISPCFFF